MKIRSLCFTTMAFFLSVFSLHAQGTVPTFEYKTAAATYTITGGDPAKGGTTTISTVLVPLRLSFEAKKLDGKPFVMDSAQDVNGLLASPVFSRFAFPEGGTTQYADALLRSTFPAAKDWHVLLGKPEIKPLSITIPIGYGYVLTSKLSGRSVAIVDQEFVQKEIFKQLPKQDGKLVIALTHNATFYAVSDATVCCTWGTHGVDGATGNSFVLSTYLHEAPAIVEESDVQPLTEQLAEFMNDPLHDPLYPVGKDGAPGNAFPRWTRPSTMKPDDEGRCGGAGVGTAYFLLEPTDTNRKNNFPQSKPFVIMSGGKAYHLQNIALLPWYTGAGDGLGSTYSFPEKALYPQPATPCPANQRRRSSIPIVPTVSPAPAKGQPNGHELIGYWSTGFPILKTSPQWDVIIVAFATPDKDAPEGSLVFHTPKDTTAEQFKADIAKLKSQGRKVMISLGGGGQFFKMNTEDSVANFVSSVQKIVSEYGFDGVDIDFESPSMDLVPGDNDFRYPITPSVIHLITGLRQLHDHFGPKFMISLVPEGSQIPSGYPSYGGQFGSYLPLTYALRDILSFVDIQDYNTPPLEGLDGEIYQTQTVDYHAAMTELLLHGFNVGGDPKLFFPPLPANKVAVGFLTDYEQPEVVDQAMDYLITGNAPEGVKYKLRNPKGYPAMIGAMFWTIDDDMRTNYRYSNKVGPQLHAYPAVK